MFHCEESSDPERFDFTVNGYIHQQYPPRWYIPMNIGGDVDITAPIGLLGGIVPSALRITIALTGTNLAKSPFVRLFTSYQNVVFSLKVLYGTGITTVERWNPVTVPNPKWTIQYHLTDPSPRIEITYAGTGGLDWFDEVSDWKVLDGGAYAIY
jgi:hypothetical protein